MIDRELKDRILKNQFADRLLEFSVDREAFQALVRALNDLAVAWRGQQFIEKDIAQDLYVTMSIIRNTLLGFQSSGLNDDVDQLEDMFIEVDRLIFEECLGTK